MRPGVDGFAKKIENDDFIEIWKSVEGRKSKLEVVDVDIVDFK